MQIAGAEKYSFEEARLYLPQERKQRLKKMVEDNHVRLVELIQTGQNLNNIDEINKLTGQMIGAKQRLEEMGGDTRERLLRVLGVYNPETDSRWFYDGFGAFEAKLFKSLIFGDPSREQIEGLLQLFQHEDGSTLSVDELIIDDRGMGTGRSLRMLMDVVKGERGLREAQLFAKNLHGIDLMQKNIEIAYKLFREGRYGFPEGKNLSVGNYLDPSDKRSDAFRDKKAHMIICMMHSCFYNTTEEEWCTFFRNVRDDLLLGGLFVFDTIDMPHFRPIDQDDTREAMSTFEDFRSQYTGLWINYCRINQRHMPEGIDLLRMPRYPIYDNTSGQGFYWREVPTMGFVDHIIDKIGGGFEIYLSRECAPQYYTKEEKEQFGEKEAEKIGFKRAVEHGRKWLKDNKMENMLKEEIRQRISSGIVDPDMILKREGRITYLSPEEEAAIPVDELILIDILGAMAGNHYRNIYHVLRRTDEPCADERKKAA